MALRSAMTELATIAELKETGIDLDVRRRCIRALATFNGLPPEFCMRVDATLADIKVFRSTYVAEAKRLMFNLACNTALQSLPPEGLPFVSDAEMARGTIVERVQQQERQRHEAFVALLKEKSSAAVDHGESVIHCRRCGSADLHFVQLQTRSADEPMTSLFCCNKCHLKWRMN
jgi:DNA-directed RNA polymerase subunit M/transcription elongation factor TFIIS